MPVRQLSPELKEKAKIELNEVEGRVEEDLQHIKEWLKKQPHLKTRTDDQFLLAFLRGCKFSLERTKEKLDFFYTVRTMLPELFKNRDPMLPEIQEILKLGLFLPMINKEDPLAPHIFLIRGGIYDPAKIKIEDVIKTNLMLMDISLIDDDSALINGFHVVQDMAECQLGHMAPPSFAKKMMMIFQNTYPNRPKGIHCFNLPSFFETMFSIMRPFLTEKMKKRMNIYMNGMEEMFQNIPQKLFPVEYGGENGTIEKLTNQVKAKVERYRDWLIEDEQFGSDEKKRPGKPKTSDELFGMEGSFRKLEID